MSRAFEQCTSLTSISFPALTTILSATNKTALQNMFDGCTNLTEIHFTSAVQARVEAQTGYSTNFGATNATIYFDL